MRRYHHKLFLKPIQDQDDTPRDADGNFMKPQLQNIFACNCREEPNGSGRKLVLPDGTLMEYSSMIYAPLECPDLDLGQELYVKDSRDRVRRKGTVSWFNRELKHCQIWV